MAPKMAPVAIRFSFRSWAFSRVIREGEYDPDAPMDALKDAIDWAEATLEELKVLFDEIYPWRHDLR